jgi:tRNA-2-methylthio-N6-dimethylallyladenosine synthase
VQGRYERLVALQEEISWAENRALVGTEVELLVAEGEGRKDGATRRLSGRARDNRLVHFGVGETAQADLPRPGDAVTVVITQAAPHHLIADGVAVAGEAVEAAATGGAESSVDGTESNVSDAPVDGAGSAIRSLRRLRSGDAWERRQAAPTESAKPSVSLGMPSVGVPAPLPVAQSCG